MTVQQVLQQALSLQQAGRLQQALYLYEAILEVEPHQVDALHLSGLAESSLGHTNRAVELISRAIELSPDSPLFHCNLGVVLKQNGRTEQAVAAYRRSLALDPSAADAHFNLGKALKSLGQLLEAEAALREAIRLQPKQSSAWCCLLSLTIEGGDDSAALAMALKARQFCPDNAEVALNLGTVQKRCQQPERAIEAFQAAIKLAPGHVEAMCKLAALHIQRLELAEGQSWLARATQLDANNVHVLNTQGLLHNTLGDSLSAETVLAKTVELHADNSTAHSNLGLALKRQGKLSQALACMRRAYQLEHRNTEPLINLGGVLIALGELSEAECVLREAITKRGGFREASDSLLMSLQYRDDVSPSDLLEQHQQWNENYAPKSADFTVAEQRTLPSEINDQERLLKVGFVSADLGEHPVGYFSVRLFEALQSQTPRRLSSVVYSDRIGRDSIAARIERSVDCWRDVAGQSDASLAETIRGDGIDILFDLAGHTAHNRLMVFARRVAPVQISWAGYVGTTGLAEMDYLLADRFHVPSEHEAYACEQVLRMPDGYVTYEPPTDAPDVSPLPALTNGVVHFAAMCNPAKVNPRLLELWGEILQQVSGSRLLLCYTGWLDLANQQRVRQVLSSFGVENQVDFAQEPNAAASMRRYRQVDMALDTMPYSGGLTTCEALWMGVPTITLPGNRFASRHALSHLSNVGLAEWIVSNREEYVSKAVTMASQLERLAALRSELRQRMLASPLCNGHLFAERFSCLLQSLVR